MEEFDTLSGYLQKCSVYMSQDRSDIWPTPQDAEADLMRWVQMIMETEGQVGSCGSGSFELSRHEDGGFISWELNRHVLDFYSDPKAPEDDCGFDWIARNPARIG